MHKLEMDEFHEAKKHTVKQVNNIKINIWNTEN